ncbi:hypothetical protein [Vibrio scophthalmi]
MSNWLVGYFVALPETPPYEKVNHLTQAHNTTTKVTHELLKVM